MDTPETTTMSSRGQIVIPQGVRDALALDAGAKFVVIGEGDTIILKRLEVPSIKELKGLLAKSRQAAKSSAVTPADVDKAIKRDRKKR
jgi:AbrB family looped-hinge helix DNA binding protein